ncbi:DEAD/DEAH box helicase, partial [Breznakiellaceae bacterium SP9]
MYLGELLEPISRITGPAKVTAEKLNKAGLSTIAALLKHYPRKWENRTHIIPLCAYETHPVCTIATVVSRSPINLAVYSKVPAFKAGIRELPLGASSGGTFGGRASISCFGRRPDMEMALTVGNTVLIWGTFSVYRGELQCSNFEYELCPQGADAVLSDGTLKPTSHFGRILPVYPLKKKLSQQQLHKYIQKALALYGSQLEDELPECLRQKYSLLPKAEALRAIHFPASMEELKQAGKRLIYEELFYMELMIGMRALTKRSLPQRILSGSTSLHTSNASSFSPLQKRLIERLPFALTQGQIAAIKEINADMEMAYPMARLLQGDVGSGKTLVAFLAALRAVESEGQAALMAPTELLARQHAETASK